MPAADKQWFIGTSGWAHRDWVGTFYPSDTAPAEYLTAYARHFETVEIEYTLFEVPSRELVQSWYRRTPDDFIFSPCVPRHITHEQRLENASGALEDFLEVITGLGEKLGPLLIQLPEDFRSTELAGLETFLHSLPRTPQFAIEFRHGSWLKETTFRLLEAYQVAWVVVDAPFLPRVPRVTAPIAYVRWHGAPGLRSQLQRQLDPAAALRPWLPLLRQLEEQAQRIYGYIHNGYSGHAPRDCRTLLDLLGRGQRGQG